MTSPDTATSTAGTGTSLDGRVALVTGAGAGLGRVEALALAAAGARVVVNDFDADAAERTAEEVRALGVEAVAAPGDVADWGTAEKLVGTALSAFGDLHVLVNNAGVTRDRLIFNISEQEWDSVVAIHLKGHAGLSRFATAHWREQSKATGGPVYARVVNTSSEAFLYGSPGQPNYAAAKAGITALTLSIAGSCARYGVRANAICPRARTAMTEGVFGQAPDEGVDPLAAEHLGPLVAYLASPAADGVTGQVFVAYGSMVAVAGAPTVAGRFDAPGAAWTADGLAGAIGPWLAERPGDAGFVATEFYALS